MPRIKQIFPTLEFKIQLNELAPKKFANKTPIIGRNAKTIALNFAPDNELSNSCLNSFST